MDSYIADLRAVTQMDMDLKIFRMNRLGIPQDRIAKKMGVNQASIHNHLLKIPVLAKLINADLSRGFTVAQVAEKHACPVGPEDRTGGWTEPMVWSLALEDKEDIERFKALNWGLHTWDQWEWNDCLPREIYVNNSEAYFTAGDKRFGDDCPDRIPAQRFSAVVVSAMQGKRMLGVTSRYVIIAL